MSHFCVAVATKKEDIEEVDRLLKPYWEELEVEPYKDEDGDETTYNPNSKWDWYSIGGRYNHWLITDKDNTDTFDDGQIGLFGGVSDGTVEGHPELKRVNAARIKDIKFDMIGGNYDKALREWELIVEEQEPQNEEE
jgi:hypothetical protein